LHNVALPCTSDWRKNKRKRNKKKSWRKNNNKTQTAAVPYRSRICRTPQAVGPRASCPAQGRSWTLGAKPGNQKGYKKSNKRIEIQ
jgi:hypothetical protein